MVISTFLIAGGVAGLAGATEVMGVQRRLISGFAVTSGAQYGTFGILTSLVAGGSPIGIPITAFFMSVLLVGANALQRSLQIPVEIVFLMQAVIVLIVVTLRTQIERRTETSTS
jgi:simple sugar transport system permease protein